MQNEYVQILLYGIYTNAPNLMQENKPESIRLLEEHISNPKNNSTQFGNSNFI